jgi:hypothetical protein
MTMDFIQQTPQWRRSQGVINPPPRNYTSISSGIETSYFFISCSLKHHRELGCKQIFQFEEMCRIGRLLKQVGNYVRLTS